MEYTVRVHFIDDSERVVPAKDIHWVGEEGARRGTAIVDGREVPIYKRSDPEWGPLWFEQAINPLARADNEFEQRLNVPPSPFLPDDETCWGDPRTPEEIEAEIATYQPGYVWRNPFTGEPL